MTDVTNLGDVWVVGQRRRPGGAFPGGGGGGGGGGNTGGPQQNELEEAGPEDPPPPPPHPCDNPDTALEWNVDAAAAKAAKEFARLAGERSPPENLNDREWGAFLYRNSDGSIRIGPINSGTGFTNGGNGSVTLIRSGSDADIVGFVHSHRSGSHFPSDGPINPDAPADLEVFEGLIQTTGNPDLRMYIVAENQGPAGFRPYNQINIYNSSNAVSARANNEHGPEVNPEAKSCSEL